MKHLLTLLLTILIAAFPKTGNAQKFYQYRIYLADKNASAYSLTNAEQFLSTKSIERRKRRNIPIDSTDLPVCSSYTNELAKNGLRILATSRWLNSVLIETPDSTNIDVLLNKLPFVSSWKEAETRNNHENKERIVSITDEYQQKNDYYGAATQNMLSVRGLRKIHSAGFRGQGMNVAIIDAGFKNADTLSLLKKTSIVAKRNFTHSGNDLFANDTHGLDVLTLMGANLPHILVGTAPEASYTLLKSEESETENPYEEDNWIAALEFADSLGIDVVNSSLGYYEFSHAAWNYSTTELDGQHSPASRAASLAASKGMLLCISIGNLGNSEWKTMTVPADAENILTIGAVNKDGKHSAFSSLGPSADGRTKPDVCVLGENILVPNENGELTKGSGTSFASPILCGAATCLWQKHPNAKAIEIIEAIRQSASLYNKPNNEYGFGLPDFQKADAILCNQSH